MPVATLRAKQVYAKQTAARYFRCKWEPGTVAVCGEAGHLIEIDSGLKKPALELESFLRHCGHCGRRVEEVNHATADQIEEARGQKAAANQIEEARGQKAAADQIEEARGQKAAAKRSQ